ncbi:MAG TPA: VWA domain-containing protein [Candidatus Binatia bacterium]|nr:VWA domain-containing protein [Candidatus Binatia bacterium]
MLFRYSRWDGTQDLGDLDADELLDTMADDLLLDGDLPSALRRLLQQGARDSQGMRQPGLRDLLDRLRRQRQERLNRYDLGSSLDDIKEKLDQVLRTEQEGIRKWLEDRRDEVRRGEGSEVTQKAFETLATDKQEALSQLPPDPAGRIRDLMKYDFLDPDARRQFQELLDSLRQNMLQPFLQGMQQSLQSMTPQDLEQMREMLRDLNRMLADKARGKEPDFEAFKKKWGQHFPGVESLDQLVDQMARQIAQMRSLLQSMSPQQRSQLEDMMRSLMLRDEQLEAALSQLAMRLDRLAPLREMQNRYPFKGQEDVTLDQAMQLMDEMQQMDQLERELRGVQQPGDLDRVDREQVEKLLGPESARDLERMRELAKKLEDAGYLERNGEELELTARAIRKIGDKALRDIFAQLKRDRFGGHVVERRGAGGDRTDETKRYEFGDPFLLDLKETVMNAVGRDGGGTPIRLAPDDFAVFRTELRTQAATVVMLDMSRSMVNNGYFLPAKKVALALAALIRGQFPRDALYVVGFSLYAREFTAAKLPRVSWTDCDIGTNMHAGFLLSRQLLARHQGGNRQIIMVTDGEPTAHLEGGVADFAYPPTRRTVQETLREVQRCTRAGITINTFMLERSPWLTAFVEEMARINRGRAFFSSADKLGEYVLVDYVRARRARAS